MIRVRSSSRERDRRQAEDVALGLIGMGEMVAQLDPGRSKDERARTVDTLVRLAWSGITGL